MGGRSRPVDPEDFRIELTNEDDVYVVTMLAAIERARVLGAKGRGIKRTLWHGAASALDPAN